MGSETSSDYASSDNGSKSDKLGLKANLTSSSQGTAKNRMETPHWGNKHTITTPALNHGMAGGGMQKYFNAELLPREKKQGKCSTLHNGSDYTRASAHNLRMYMYIGTKKRNKYEH